MIVILWATLSNEFFFMKMFLSLFKFHWTLFPSVVNMWASTWSIHVDANQVTIKPLPEPMMIKFYKAIFIFALFYIKYEAIQDF